MRRAAPLQLLSFIPSTIAQNKTELKTYRSETNVAACCKRRESRMQVMWDLGVTLEEGPWRPLMDGALSALHTSGTFPDQNIRSFESVFLSVNFCFFWYLAVQDPNKNVLIPLYFQTHLRVLVQEYMLAWDWQPAIASVACRGLPPGDSKELNSPHNLPPWWNTVSSP